MPAPLTTTQQQWIVLEGTLGEFVAPGTQVPVRHLSTFASLGDSGTGSTRLTRDLLPVREMFEVGDLNFDELLQRDLDDYRVATEIIPYLLRNGPMVRFFPPILAVVVPVANKRVLDYYPAPVESRAVNTVQKEYEDVTETYDGCLQLTRYYAHGSYSSSAQLKFNPDQARLVVIDGQHRAMAMLAIRREKTGDWGDKGRDFRHFYEDVAAELRSNEASAAELNKIEMPVCICFFPTLFQSVNHTPPYTTIHCCRKLFLDVNKNAKRPTNARQLLLDDANILSVITRGVLTTVRAEARVAPNPEIELDAFEYDSPENSPVPTRDLAICSVEMLRQLIYWSGFGPSQYYTDILRRPQGRPADPDKQRFLTEILFDEAVSTAEWGSWGYKNFDEEFSPKDCRMAAQDKLAELFSQCWGRAIINILARMHPFRAHHQAVAQLRAEHRDETGHGLLAWRALFDGQGVLWTLEGYAEHRAKQRAELEKLGQKLPEVQLERAYNAINDNWIPKEFLPNRAAYFLGKKVADISDADKAMVARSYKTMVTQAFQIGILMTFAFLKQRLNIKKPEDFLAAVDSWIASWNSVMSQGTALRAFDRETSSKGLMSYYFGSLQPSDWYWFRYFNLEILTQSKDDFPGKDEARAAAEQCRDLFIRFFARAIWNQERRLGNTKIDEAAAERTALERWREALNHAIGLKKQAFDAWAKSRNTAKVAAIASEAGEAEFQDGTEGA